MLEMRIGDAVMMAAGGTLVPPGSLRPVENMLGQLAGELSIPVPSLWILTSDDGNALAAGDSPYVAAVGVTTGALSQLRPLELRSVLAHELAHIACGQLADRTAEALTSGGIVARRLGGSGMTLGRVLGAFHPVLGIAVGAAGYGAARHGTTMINQAFAHNRAQEAEADAVAIRLGLGRTLASALVKLEHNRSPRASLPPWSHTLLFTGRLNLADHPPTPQRVAVALAGHFDERRRCWTCWAGLTGPEEDCICGSIQLPPSACECGVTPAPDDRFCGDCGRWIVDAPCRLCGTRNSGLSAFCHLCRFRLP